MIQNVIRTMVKLLSLGSGLMLGMAYFLNMVWGLRLAPCVIGNGSRMGLSSSLAFLRSYPFSPYHLSAPD